MYLLKGARKDFRFRSATIDSYKTLQKAIEKLMFGDLHGGVPTGTPITPSGPGNVGMLVGTAIN